MSRTLSAIDKFFLPFSYTTKVRFIIFSGYFGGACLACMLILTMQFLRSPLPFQITGNNSLGTINEVIYTAKELDNAFNEKNSQEFQQTAERIVEMNSILENQLNTFLALFPFSAQGTQRKIIFLFDTLKRQLGELQDKNSRETKAHLPNLILETLSKLISEIQEHSFLFLEVDIGTRRLIDASNQLLQLQNSKNDEKLSVILPYIHNLIQKAYEENSALNQSTLYDINTAFKELSILRNKSEKKKELSKKIYDVNSILFSEIDHVLRLQRQTILFKIVVGIGLIIFGISLVFVLYMTRVIRKPLTNLKIAVDSLTNGDLSARVEISSKDEIAILSEGFNRMATFFEKILSEAIHITNSLVQSAQSIFFSAKTLEQNMEAQERSVLQITDNTKEISRSVQETARSLLEVSKGVTMTSDLAGVGRISLIDLETIMQQMAEASRSIVSMLNELREKVGNINRVINAIVKIADQINLLSLNTAIRAGKAGNEGLGFSVVANKIKELASQTAFTTLDIEKIVEEIINTVGSTAVEVEQFSIKIDAQVSDATLISDELKDLISYTQEQINVFTQVNVGMQDQSRGVEDIRYAADVLIETANQTKNSVQLLHNEIEYMYEVSHKLEEMTSKFRTI